MVTITPEYLARSGTEDGEQSALFCYAADMVHGRAGSITIVPYGNTVAYYPLPADPRWRLLYAIPNGGKREPATAARLKATGVKRGFPDVGLPIPKLGFAGMFIEMKKANGTMNNVDDPQTVWHTDLTEQGYYVVVAFGWKQAVELITEYLRC